MSGSPIEATPQFWFKDKPSFIENCFIFTPMLDAITLAHNYGSVKYDMYSYLNTPEGNDGTIKNSLDALVRHFLLYVEQSPITTVDESQMSHLIHLGCRAHMCVTSYYRKIFYTLQDVEPDKKINTRELAATANAMVPELAQTGLFGVESYDQISNETFIFIERCPKSLLTFMNTTIPHADKRLLVLDYIRDLIVAIGTRTDIFITPCRSSLEITSKLEWLCYFIAVLLYLDRGLVKTEKLNVAQLNGIQNVHIPY